MEFVLLNKSHNKKEFSCEEPSLTSYLKTQASQDIKKKLSTCFVAVDENNRVNGYYTLSSDSIGRENLPEEILNRLPASYNAPVILLGRLARDIKHKGTGLGSEILIDALCRSYNISSVSIGAMAVVVEPLSLDAERFYSKFGFIKLKTTEKMFIPMKTIKKLKFALDARAKSAITL